MKSSAGSNPVLHDVNGSYYWLLAVLNFDAYCLDWPLALGPQIRILCPDQNQGFPAIARGPGGTSTNSVRRSSP